MDELAKSIGKSMLPKAEWDEMTPTLRRWFMEAAAAVRAHLLSDEAVERAASAMADEVNLSLAGFDERTRNKYLRQSRAAIAALLKDRNA